MKFKSYKCAIGSVGGIAAIAWASNSFAAMDIDMMDFVPAPAGTDALLSYTTFIQRRSYTANGEPRVDRDTKLNSVSEILRYAHYMLTPTPN